MISGEILSIAAAVLIALVFIFFLTRRSGRSKKQSAASLVKSFSAFLSGDDNAALNEMKKMTEAGNTSPELFLAIGLILRKKEDFTKAAQVHAVLLGNPLLDNDFKNALIGELARDYMLAGQTSKAITLLQDNPVTINEPDNLITLALCNLSLQNYDAALEYHKKYYKITGNYLKGFFCKCMIEKAVHAPSPKAAMKYIKAALDNDNTSRSGHIIKGTLLLKSEKYNKAADEFGYVINKGLLRDIKDFKQIEKGYIAAGKEAELTELLKKNAEEGNINPFVHIALSDYYEYGGDKARAVSILQSYMDLPDAKVIAAKIFSEKSGDKMTARLIKDVFLYECSVCGLNLNSYKDDCPKCYSFDTIYPK